jgi:phage/plasmid-like protein (TIGR03299 family)
MTTSYGPALTIGSDAPLAAAYPGRRSAWAQLGTSVAGSGDAQAALVTAGLANWNIRKVPMTGTDITTAGVTQIENPDSVMLVYTDPRTERTRYLSTVGSGYGVHQNEAGAALIDALVAESGAQGIGYAGAIKGGKQTFVTIELPGVMHVDGVDALQLHLVVFNSHDGSSAFRVMIVPFRPFCANQLDVAIKDQVSMVSIRHTSKSTINVEQIRKRLGLLYKFSHAFEAEVQKLIRTEMTNTEFNDLIREVWSLDDDASKRTVNAAERRTHELNRLWSAKTQENVRGSRYAAFQSVVEYEDHYGSKNPDIRATRVLTSKSVSERKQTAFDLLAA